MNRQYDRPVRMPMAGSAQTVWHLARLEESLPSGGSAYARIYELDTDGDLSLTGERVRARAYTVPDYYTLSVGTIVRIEWHDTMQRWFVTGVYS